MNYLNLKYRLYSLNTTIYQWLSKYVNVKELQETALGRENYKSQTVFFDDAKYLKEENQGILQGYKKITRSGSNRTRG